MRPKASAHHLILSVERQQTLAQHPARVHPSPDECPKAAFLACMAAAAAFYHLPPRVLPAIQAVEGGRVGLAHLNANNTADLGVMQVNTIWIQPLARFARMPPDAVAARLVNDPCFNIAAAAAIMRVYLDEARGNLMIAIGHYHSHTPSLSFAYQQKVLSAAGTLFRSNRHAAPAPVSQP